MPRRFVLAPANPNLVPPMPRRNFLSRVLAFAAGGAVLAPASRVLAAPGSTSGAEPWIGEIAMVAFNFAPTGWALCNGQLLPISQNTALFSLIGTYYGGNGQTSFGLPNLQGRVPLHMGSLAGGGFYGLGQTGGEEFHVLSTNEIPAHTHGMRGDAANGISDTPTGLNPARNPAGIPAYGAGSAAVMGGAAIGNTGGSQAHNNVPPYLTLNFIIALQGIFPSRP